MIMKLLDLRKQLKNKFAKHNIDVEDVDFICAEVLKVKRTELILIDEITNDQCQEIQHCCELRLSNKPVDKIFGKAYFYGLEFCVDENVLTPRPETEILVEKAIHYIKQKNLKTCLDLCTGSGCLAIAIKKFTSIDVIASDISKKALTVAKQNAKNNDVDIKFVYSNMFENLTGKFDMIVSNPPYIDSQEINTLDEEVKLHDPILALDGGDLGMKFYSIIHNNARKFLCDDGLLILEIGEDQKNLIISLFNDFTLVESLKDYSGNDRVLILKK